MSSNPDQLYTQALEAQDRGDWQRVVDSMAEPAPATAVSWDLQCRAMVVWIRLLRGETVPDAKIEELLAAGRRSGFHRLAWVALGQSAFCLALLGRRDEARGLLTELGESWQKVRAIASGCAERVASSR